MKIKITMKPGCERLRHVSDGGYSFTFPMSEIEEKDFHKVEKYCNRVTSTFKNRPATAAPPATKETEDKE